MDNISDKKSEEQEAFIQDEDAFVHQFQMKDEPDEIPADRFKFVYILFVLFGIGTLLPWNMFITAKAYYTDYKLNVKTGKNSTDIYLEDLRKNFHSIIGIAAQVTNLVCAALNIIIKNSDSPLVRIKICILIKIIVTIATIALCIIGSSGWPIEFFYITIFSVIAIYMAASVFQNCLYGLASQLTFHYPNAVVLGSNISGTFTSVVSIISLALSPDLKISSIYYFTISLCVLIFCLLSCFILTKSKFYQHFTRKRSQTQRESKLNFSLLWDVTKQAWPQFLNVFMVFFVSLSVFPSVLANISSTRDDLKLGEVYFLPVACFLAFNLFAMVGNFVPNIIVYPSPSKLWIPIWIRLIFIPFFLMCNFNLQYRKWSVWFSNDIIFALGSSLLGLTSGYYSSLSMMYAAQTVDPSQASTAGMLAAFFLVLGICVGVNISLLFTFIVEK